MPTHNLVIAPVAKDDLKAIYLHGLNQWGQAQSGNYLNNLKECLWLLTEQPLMGIERPELLCKARSLTIESHTVFYTVTANTAEIIRILHSRQDPKRHLK